MNHSVIIAVAVMALATACADSGTEPGPCPPIPAEVMATECPEVMGPLTDWARCERELCRARAELAWLQRCRD